MDEHRVRVDERMTPHCVIYEILPVVRTVKTVVALQSLVSLG